ncbi:hypothetical protein RDI58_023302 [Solanum bulbocastanum]|uniref:C2 domain-containing protein n=1 Tax=Solanum bulbocastanum TaxID=147425 RepID=A0AAN8TAT2_SOLBU
MGVLKPFQLLEINIISAQDLEPMSKKMKTYATVWVHPTRKLTTAVDIEGGNNPTWNDKFVFRVDEEFLRQDTSAVQIEIHCGHWFKDSLVGSVRVLVGNLIPPPSRTHHNHHPHNLGMRFVALQVRRPSGRPQGILNIGVALLDSTMRSMPLYTELNKSAVGYRDLMEEEQLPHHHHNQKTNNEKTITTTTTTNNYNNNNTNTSTNNNNVTTIKPILLRTKSERSERVKFDDDVPKSSGSIVVKPSKKKNKAHNYDIESSILSISLEPPPQMLVKKKGKASSMVSGPKEDKPKSKKGKTGSVLSDSIVSKESSLYNTGPKEDKPKLKLIALELENKEKPTNEKKVDEKSLTKPNVVEPKEPITVIGKPIQNYNGYEFGGPKGLGHNGKFVFGGPIKGNAHHWTDSEIGPSASEVAAAVAEKKYPLDDQKSSVLDGWSLDESVEGLRSKLERWRTEVPPVYDQGHASSSYHSTGRHARRHARGSSGLFSCFGNIMGYECQCICGKPQKKYNTRFYSPSVGSRSLF